MPTILDAFFILLYIHINDITINCKSLHRFRTHKPAPKNKKCIVDKTLIVLKQDFFSS